MNGATAAAWPASAIRIRDPFILPHPESGLYFLYAQVHNRDGALPAGVEVYWSRDLKQWTGPEPVLTLSEGFWGPRTIWAPEVHLYRGRYYLFATMHPDPARIVDGLRHKGTQVFVSDSPRGPFTPFANRPHTPAEWMSLDGTLYVEDGQPWMVFCREWGQVGDGTMECMKLRDDLSSAAGEPITLFRGSDASWSAPIGPERNAYVTDGPFLYRSVAGKLIMIWSTMGKEFTYKQGMAVSASGRVAGPWQQIEPPLIETDGGHGMLFRTFEGDLLMAIHHPNKGDLERLHLFSIQDRYDRIALDEAIPLP